MFGKMFDRAIGGALREYPLYSIHTYTHTYTRTKRTGVEHARIHTHTIQTRYVTGAQTPGPTREHRTANAPAPPAPRVHPVRVISIIIKNRKRARQ